MPVMKTTGRKTTIVVIVEASTAIPTSPGTLNGRLLRGFPGAPVAVDVFQHHDGIVHQAADAQGQAPQGEHIQAEVVEIQEAEGADDGDGDGEGDDQGAAHVAEEDQDDQHGQTPRPMRASCCRFLMEFRM